MRRYGRARELQEREKTWGKQRIKRAIRGMGVGCERGRVGEREMEGMGRGWEGGWRKTMKRNYDMTYIPSLGNRKG